ncbi:unnamed protein product, partial [Symbiodinium pilosum]
VKIIHSRPWTAEDRANLTQQLHSQGLDVDTSNPRIHKARGEGQASMDLVPFAADYYPQGFHAGYPRNGFKHNTEARLAVKELKLRAAEHGRKIRGYSAEQAVLKAQQQHKHADFRDLRAHAEAALSLGC